MADIYQMAAQTPTWLTDEDPFAQQSAAILKANPPPAPPEPPDPEDAVRLQQAQANVERTQVQIQQIQAQIAVLNAQARNAETPEERQRAAEAQRQAQIQLVQLQDQLATQRQAADNAAKAAEAEKQRQFQAQQAAQQQQFQSGESAATRSFTAQENAANRGMQADVANLNTQVALRGQEIDRLQAQDNWYVNMLQAQIAAGNLSLQKATNYFDAYVQQARLPTDIMQAISSSISPFLPYMTGMREGQIPPGFEAGGPMEGLVTRAGGTYNPENYAVHPVSVDLKGMAESAGADFSKSGKLPSPDEVFGSVQVPSVDTSRQSALATANLPTPALIGAGGSPSSPPAPQGGIPSTMVPSAPSSMQMTDAEKEQVLAAIRGGG